MSRIAVAARGAAAAAAQTPTARFAARFGLLGILTLVMTLPYAVPALWDAVALRLEWERGYYLLKPVENQRIFLQLAFLAAALPYAALCIVAPPRGVARNALVPVALLLLGVLVLSAAFGQSPAFSLRGLLMPAAAFGAFLLLATTRPGTIEAEKILFVAVAAMIPAALYAVAQSQGYEILPYSRFVSEETLEEVAGKQLVSSTFGHPNYMASFFAPLLFWAMRFALSPRRRVHRVVGTVAGLAVVAALITAGTRGAWLAVIVAGVPLYLLLALSRDYRRQFLFAGGVALVFIIAIVLIPNPLLQLRFDLTDRLLASKEIASRLYYWLIGLEMFRAFPLLGVGPGCYNLLFWEYVDAFQLGSDGDFYRFVLTDIVRGVPPGFAHNDYLQILAETGVVGISAWFLFWGILLGQCWAEARHAGRMGDARVLLVSAVFLASFVAMAVDALFNFPFHIPASLSLFFVMAGAWVLFRESLRRHSRAE